MSLADAYEKINAWVSVYKDFQPHSSLDDLTPAEIVEQYQKTTKAEMRNHCLPAACLHEAMYFATAEHPSTAPENTYLHEYI